MGLITKNYETGELHEQTWIKREYVKPTNNLRYEEVLDRAPVVHSVSLGFAYLRDEFEEIFNISVLKGVRLVEKDARRGRVLVIQWTGDKNDSRIKSLLRTWRSYKRKRR